MKSLIFIEGLVLTDSRGEWWEGLKNNGQLATQHTRFDNDKYFPTLEKAIKFGDKHLKRYRVVQIDPPVRPIREWKRTILHEGIGTP